VNGKLALAQLLSDLPDIRESERRTAERLHHEIILSGDPEIIYLLHVDERRSRKKFLRQLRRLLGRCPSDPDETTFRRVLKAFGERPPMFWRWRMPRGDSARG
jgi:hypothetical protein